MWEWLLWTGLITFLLLAIGALFLFSFVIELVVMAVGLGTLVWVRFRRFPPLFAAYEQQLARQRYLSRQKAARPEATICSRGPKPAKRRRR
jgi:hypothetical protein